MTEIFISYKTEERHLAERLARALEEQDYDVWWDQALAAGDDFRKKIKAALDNARAVVVIWSKLSVESSFVLDEADRAAAKNKLIPVRFDPEVEPPMGFGLFQIADLSKWDDRPDSAKAPEIKELCSQIEAIRKGGGAVLRTDMGSQFFGPAAEGLSLQRAAVWGLPWDRFLKGSLALIIALSAAGFLSIVFHSESMNDALATAALGAFASLLGVPMIRAVYQYLAVKRGRSSRRFFDQDFTFWVMCAGLMAIPALVLQSYDFNLFQQLVHFPAFVILILGVFSAMGLARGFLSLLMKNL